MKKVAINVKEGKFEGAREFTSSYMYGETLEECAKMFGEDVVLQGFLKSDIITLQGKIRKVMQKAPSTSDEKLEEIVSAHIPGVKSRITFQRDPEEALIEKAKHMSPEEVQALIKRIQDRIG